MFSRIIGYYLQLGVPVHCMTINVRRHQLVCGVYGGIRVYALDAGRLDVVLLTTLHSVCYGCRSVGCRVAH